MVLAIPGDKRPDAVGDRCRWTVSGQAFQNIRVGKRARDIALLHWHIVADGFAADTLFDFVDKGHQSHRCPAGDVDDAVGGDRRNCVIEWFAVDRPDRHALCEPVDTFDQIVDVGEIALDIAVIVDVDR